MSLVRKGWRAKREFKREAKRLTRLGEPVVWDVSREIYDDYVRTVALFEAHGFRPSQDHAYIKNWAVKKRSRR